MAVVSLGLTAVAVMGYTKFVDAPTEAVRSMDKPAVRGGADKVMPAAMNTLAGLAVELQYPVEFDVVSQLKNDANAIEQYNISSKADYRRSIGVYVRALPTGRLEDESGYRFRQQDTAQYHLIDVPAGVDKVAIMDKTDHREQTLFWIHGGKVVTICVTSSSPKDDVPAIMARIKPTVRWK